MKDAAFQVPPYILAAARGASVAKEYPEVDNVHNGNNVANGRNGNVSDQGTTGDPMRETP